MAKMLKGNAVIGQSGGPTAVINQSLVGVIESINRARQITKLLGARHGVRGIVDGKFIDLKGLKKPLLERVAATPAAALGSSRDKPDEAYCQKIFKVFEKHDVRYFFYIGGNDSADTARIVNDMASESGYELRTFHIPKTIDNDLRVTDHCPGYGSAAKFVASAFMGDDRDNAALPGVKINVVMGRHAGWLTAASVLGREDTKDGPHLVYLPEVPFSLTHFVDDVKRVLGRLGRCQIAVSEGIADKSGNAMVKVLADKLDKEVERDSHGNIQLSGTGSLGDFLSDYVKEKVGGKKPLRVRADTFGYLQRSFAGYASEVDQAEARECGRKAVDYALAGNIDGSVAIRRLGDKTAYAADYFLAPLKDVARDTKDLPRSYINKAGNGVTKGFRDYAMPLVGRLPETGKLF